MANNNSTIIILVVAAIGLVSLSGVSILVYFAFNNGSPPASSSSSASASASNACTNDPNAQNLSWGGCTNCPLSTTETACFNCPVGDSYWGRWNYPQNTSCCDFNMQNCDKNLGPNCARAGDYADSPRNISGKFTNGSGGTYSTTVKFNSTKDLCFDCQMVDPANSSQTIYGRTKGGNMCCDASLNFCHWKKV